MKTLLPLFAVLALALPVRAATEDERLTDFFRAYLDEAFRLRPLEATRLGDHRFDHLLDDVSAKGRQSWTAHYQATRDDLRRRIDVHKLSRSGQIDYKIFDRYLEYALWQAKNTRPFETDPRVYNEYLSDSTFILLTQSTRPRAEAVRSCQARIELLPRILKAARANLRAPVKVMLETAIRQNSGTIAYYESGIYEVAGESPQRSTLKPAADRLLPQLRQYQTFLEGLRNSATDDWRLGRDRFVEKLDLELDANLSADQVFREAELEFARVERELYVVARQLWSRCFPRQPLPPDDEAGRSDTIRKVLAHYNRDHGKPDQLVQDARATVQRIRDFIKERDLLRLPEPDRCRIIEMPEFQRGNSVAYLNPAPPMDPRAASHYAISPPPRDWSRQRVQTLLEEYNRHMLQILTIHEAYPGHYVQLEYSNRCPSLIRRVLSSGVFAEGWAVYTEQMMLDQGYGDGELVLRLNQLKWYLRTVANAILDYRMHCTDMSDEQAQDFLTRRAFQSEGEAVGKIIRAKQSSCQLSTYFVGRTAFYRLRQQIERELGDRFDLGRFHEAVLDHGTLPVKYLPELVRARLKQPR
jgi:uncharacterized protein (DUF885 family)